MRDAIFRNWKDGMHATLPRLFSLELRIGLFHHRNLDGNGLLGQTTGPAYR